MDDLTPVPLANLLKVTQKFDGTIAEVQSDDLNTIHWNINHLTNKLHQVLLLIVSFPGILHIIAISETWLDVENSSTFNLHGYHAIHNFRRHSEGGGISLFIHKSLCNDTPNIIINEVTNQLHHFLIVEIPFVKLTVAVAIGLKATKLRFLTTWRNCVLTSTTVYWWVTWTSTSFIQIIILN